MNWIIREFFKPLPFYAIFAALWVWMGTELGAYTLFWAPWSLIVLGAIFFNVVFIVCRILWATYKKRQAK